MLVKDKDAFQWTARVSIFQPLNDTCISQVIPIHIRIRIPIPILILILILILEIIEGHDSAAGRCQLLVNDNPASNQDPASFLIGPFPAPYNSTYKG